MSRASPPGASIVPTTRTVTSALHGSVRDDPRTRQEFLALTGRTTHA